jgi:hypothetical protein
VERVSGFLTRSFYFSLIIRLKFARVQLEGCYGMVRLVYSCCSHLDYKASVKRFVSLQFLNLRHSAGLLGRVISLSQGRYLTQTQNKHKQTSMLLVGLEPTIPAFERAKSSYLRPRGHCDRHATEQKYIYDVCMKLNDGEAITRA